MAIESPLFQSAMELLGHSLTHYNGKNELDRKLVILHLANAVELILKDLVLDAGETIYKGPKETISIHACLTVLAGKGVVLPFLNKIELLIDERNALQHRFGSPNQLTSIFYMNIAQEFFKDVLKRHYSLEYDEVLAQFADEQALAAMRLSEPSNDQELEKLQELAKLHPLGALLSAWSYYERAVEGFVKRAGLDFGPGRPFALALSRGRFDSYGVKVPDDIKVRLDWMRTARNMAAHGHGEPSRDDVVNAVKVIEEIESYLNSLDADEINMAAKQDRELYEQQRLEYMISRRRNAVHGRAQQGLELEEVAP